MIQSDRTRLFILASVVFIAIGVLFAPEAAVCGLEQAARPPNILVILLDDLGSNDVGAYGNAEAPTPEMNRLAGLGVRFTRHYADATCSPTRVGLFTGTHAASHGFRPVHQGISPEVTTLAESLKTAGYQTYHVGKWHMGHTSRLALPSAQGFDMFFGNLIHFFLKGPDQHGQRIYQKPTYINPWLETHLTPPQQHQGHLTDILTDHAIDLITKRQATDPPWFINLWYSAPHTPLEPSQSYIDMFEATPKGRFYALLRQLDANIGRLLKTLAATDQMNNTLIFLLGDNGGTNKETNNNFPFFGDKASFNEGGVRTPLIISWPNKLVGNTVVDRIVTHFDIYPTAVAAAGLPLPNALIGVNLFPVIEGKLDPRRDLFYCYSDSEHDNIGMLTADGRWRMVNDFSNVLRLYDLSAVPAGNKDVAADQEEVVATLRQRFIEWHRRQRVLRLDYHALNEKGHARITGHSLQRSPGYAGFTFAVSLCPETSAAEKEFIVFQRNQWELWRDKTGVHAVMNGIRLTGPTLEVGKSASIIVTAHFRFSILNPKINRGIAELYLNGSLADQQQISNPELPHDDFLQPTYIGRDDHGAYPFSGTIQQPVFYNERVVSSKGAGKIGNDVETVLQELAAGAKGCREQTKGQK